MLTRAALKALCHRLADNSPGVFTTIGLSTLRDLEAGLTRPKLTTLSTLAAALQVGRDELFPNGHDDPIRNPKGRPRKISE